MWVQFCPCGQAPICPYGSQFNPMVPVHLFPIFHSAFLLNYLPCSLLAIWSSFPEAVSGIFPYRVRSNLYKSPSFMSHSDSACLGEPWLLYLCHHFSASKSVVLALTGVTQLVGYHPTRWKVTSSIPGQGTGLGCEFSPQLGSVWESTSW